jgi:hypothetical protein
MSRTTTNQLRGEMFSVQSVLRLCNEDQLPLVVSCEPVKGVSLELAVRRDADEEAEADERLLLRATAK